MTPEMLMTLAILIVAIFLFITELLRVDVVALLALLALMLTKILTVDEALAGFSSSAVLLIAALFIVGGAVFQTGLANTIADGVVRVAGTSETRLLIVVMAAVAVMSGFMSNTGTVAVLMPAIIGIALRLKLSPGRLLIPLAFASSLGGAATLIGTPPNIIVSEALQEAGYGAFDFFDFAPMGIVLIITGIGFMLAARPLLPNRKPDQETQQASTPAELLEEHRLPDSIFKMRVRTASPFVDRPIQELGIHDKYDIDILEISRPAPPRTLAAVGETLIVVQTKRNIPVHPRPDTVLQHNDVLIVRANGGDVAKAAAAYNLAIQPKSTDDYEALISQEVGVAEVVLPPRSSLIGKNIVELRFGRTYRLTVLGIKRPGTERVDLKQTPLQFGDTLLVQGEWKDIFELRKRRRDFVLIGGTAEIRSHLQNREKAPIALLIMLGMLVVLVTGWLPTTTAAMLAALLVVLTGCLTMDDAYASIDWKSIVLIAAMIPMSTAMVNVGLIDMIANTFTQTLGQYGALEVMGGLFLLTSVFTQVLSNTATTVILAPLAIATAISLEVAPQAFLMTVAVSASMAFATPVASPVNTLVMGAGNYRFADYIKIGTPLILVTFVVSMIVLPLLFPF
ncbi:MAG: SLC13 family permease [Anaerolineae bacterium]|nr:SLC13 family permease [Anaerolineae bacterium]